MEACETCKFFRPDTKIVQRNDSGRCRRFPPGWVLTVGEKSDVRSVYVQQPLAFAGDWCGEFKKRPKAKKKESE